LKLFVEKFQLLVPPNFFKPMTSVVLGTKPIILSCPHTVITLINCIFTACCIFQQLPEVVVTPEKNVLLYNIWK